MNCQIKEPIEDRVIKVIAFAERDGIRVEHMHLEVEDWLALKAYAKDETETNDYFRSQAPGIANILFINDGRFKNQPPA